MTTKVTFTENSASSIRPVIRQESSTKHRGNLPIYWRTMIHGAVVVSVLLFAFASGIQAASIPVSTVDRNAATNQWSSASYGEFQRCLAQGLAAYGAFYNRQFNALPIGKSSSSGVHINLTSAPGCNGYPGVNNAHGAVCVSVNWCIRNRPSQPLLCVEECVIHEAAESLGPQVYDAAQGHTTIVNGCAMPDFIVPANVQKQTGFKDAADQMPLK